MEVSYSTTMRSVSGFEATLTYECKEGFSVLVGGKKIPNPFLFADFFTETPRDVERFFSWINLNYTIETKKANQSFHFIFKPTSSPQIHEIKKKLIECDKLNVATTSNITVQDQEKIDLFLKGNNKVLLAIHDEINLGIAEELTSKLLVKCKTEKDYVPVLVDLTKLQKPRKPLDEIMVKYGDLGKEIIGHADYQTVFIVYGYDKISPEFNFYVSMASQCHSFKVILLVPESYSEKDELLFVPSRNNSPVGKPEIYHLETTAKSTKAEPTSMSDDVVDIFYV